MDKMLARLQGPASILYTCRQVECKQSGSHAQLTEWKESSGEGEEAWKEMEILKSRLTSTVVSGGVKSECFNIKHSSKIQCIHHIHVQASTF
jgi:hypothetical protein